MLTPEEKQDKLDAHKREDKRPLNKILKQKMIDVFGEEMANSANIHDLAFPEEILEKFYSWIKKDKNIFWFSGNPGCGKSHMACAYCNHLLDLDINFRLMPETEFYAILRAAIQKNWEAEYEIARLCETDYFILDDVGASLNFNNWHKEQLFSFVDKRWTSQKPTFMTSNLLSAE